MSPFPRDPGLLLLGIPHKGPLQYRTLSRTEAPAFQLSQQTPIIRIVDTLILRLFLHPVIVSQAHSQTQPS
jgi:hypothetical protein